MGVVLRHRWHDAVTTVVVMAALAFAFSVPAAPFARAAGDPVALGGGSGIVIDGDTFCTLTAIGNDDRGNLVGFTSA
ncbi:MAG: hypothetical protein QOF25_4160, partial [Mycobacterium sp.]|nr:hypothetical protein [Mycobacterium sp.]